MMVDISSQLQSRDPIGCFPCPWPGIFNHFLQKTFSMHVCPTLLDYYCAKVFLASNRVVVGCSVDYRLH